MKYLILVGGRLAQLEANAISPQDLVSIDKGKIVLFRPSPDGYEYATVTSRAVDDPGNSLDETRYDQAVDGRIWEIDGWKKIDTYVPGQGIVSDEVLRRPAVDRTVDSNKAKEPVKPPK